jgi:hypothetical protein
MSSADDILFAPIFPPSGEALLRELIRSIMTTPSDKGFTDQITQAILALMRLYGITDDQEIAQIVANTIKDLGGG